MPSVSLIDPYSQQAEEIARRQRMAQALQESGSQVLQMPTTPGVLISPYAGLAKILESGYGAYKEKKAREDYGRLQNEYRTNYENQFGKLAEALASKGVPGSEGTNEIPYEPAVTKPIYGPDIIYNRGGFGPDTQQQGDVIGEEIVKPEVLYQAGTPSVPGQPAGFISPELLKEFNIPEVKQLAMAKYLKQLEPQQVTLGENQRLLERTGGGEFKELVGAAKTAKATEPKWEKGVKTVNGKSVYGWYDLAAPNYEASFKEGAVPPANETKLIEVTRGGKVYLENPAIADTAARQAAAIEKEAAPVKKIRVERTKEDGSTEIILMDESDTRLAEGFATKGPNYVSITEVNPKGETVVRQVKQDDAILKTGVVKPLEGFFGQLQALGVPIGDWKNNPALAEMVNRYFVKGVGGADVESVAGYDLQKMKVLAELGYQGIRVPQAVLDKLNIKATPGLLGGAATNALPLPADRDKKKLINGQTYQTDQGPARWDAALGQFVK